MHTKRLPILLAFFLLTSVNLMAQGFMGSQITEQEKEGFRRRVKGIEQFIKRFNFEEDIQGKEIKGLEMSTEDFVSNRKNSLIYLLDYQQYSDISPAEEKLVFGFIDYVNKPDSTALFLDFYDDRWYAVTTLAATYQGKPTEVRLTLKNEQTGQQQSKWVVVGAKVEFLEMRPKNPSAFLPPNASGTNFIDLADALENPENALAYTSSQYQLDPLALFFAQLQLGALKMGRVKNVEFHLLQLPGWAITIKEFNRLDAPNSGWLISNISILLNREQYQTQTLGIPSPKS